MTEFLPFVVVGVAAGAIYGLAGVGLVLTYRTSGVFNFAHGAVASAGAYVFFELSHQHGWPWPLAAAVAIGIFGGAAGIAVELLTRPLSTADAATKVVATVGLLLVIQGTITAIYGPVVQDLPHFLPTSTFAIGSTAISWAQLTVVVVGATTTAVLSIVLRRTRTGTAMRAVVDDSTLLELTGISAATTRRIAWMLGGAVASMSGVLLAPTLGLDPTMLTLLVVQAFGAAAIGRFRSLPMTFVGGLIIGVGAALGQKYVTDFPSLLGLPPSLPFVVLFVVLVTAKPGTLFEAGAVRRRRLDRFSSLPPTATTLLIAGGAAVILMIPAVAGSRLPVFISAAGHVIVFLSLSLLVKVSGQVSLCQAAFVAVGAAAFGQLTHSAGLPWLLALLVAGAVTVPVGALVAIPAIRLSGVYLALATFGFGVLLERMGYRTFLLFGREGARLSTRPEIGPFDFGIDRSYFYLVVAIAGVAVAAVVGLQRSRLGRLLNGVADSPRALTAFGASVNTALVLVFCISGFLAGVGGAVLASGTQTAGAGSFTFFHSLLWLAVIAIAGQGVVRSSIVAALAVAVLPIYLPDGWQDYQTIVFGGLAVLVAVLSARQFDLAARIKADLGRVAARRHGPAAARRLVAHRSPVAARTHHRPTTPAGGTR